MLLYGIIVLLAGLAMLVVSILICLGHTNLIHEYHQNNVKEEDKKKFGLSMGLSLSLGSLGMITSSLIALLSNDESLFVVTILILLIPLFLSIILLFIFTIKFNGKFID